MTDTPNIGGATDSDGAAKPQNKFYATEIFLGSLVAMLTILTAIAAFQGSRLGVDAGRSSGRSVRTLLESNAAFLSSSQDVSADLTLYGLSLSPDLDDIELNFYQSSFSPALQAALDRTGGDPTIFPFDAQYDDEQYGLADDLFDEVFVLVDEAGDKRAQSQRFQLATFIFAIGLAFSSWASLAGDGARMRQIFALFAIGTAVVGIGTYGFALVSLA